METISHWITQYGYGGLFLLLMLGIVGVPIPDEILLVFCGNLIFKGRLSFLTTSLVALIGTVCGISLSYILGRTLGYFILHRYGSYIHITQERINQAHNWFERVGRWSLLFGYFVPGFRHVMAYFCGATELAYWEFALFAYCGALLWSQTFLIIGYFFGEKWSQMSDHIHRIILLAAGVIALLAIGYYVLHQLVIKRRGRPKK